MMTVQDTTLPAALRKPRLRRTEASEYLMLKHGLPIKPATLAKYACLGGGPELQHFNRTPLYHRDELDKWAAKRLGKPVSSTSEIEA